MNKSYQVPNRLQRTMKQKTKLLSKKQKNIKNRPQLLTKRQKNMKNQQKMTNKDFILSPILISKPLSYAGKLLVNPNSSPEVKSVAASRLRIEKFWRDLRWLRFLKSLRKRSKNNKH